MKKEFNGHREFSSEEISKVIARCRASGLGVRRFAQEQGIPSGRLHYWVYQKSRARSRRPLVPGAKSAPGPVFQEIQLATGGSVAGWAAEVSGVRGLVVRFSASAEPAWMGEVIRELGRPC